MINRAMFQRNGRAGYVLKPLALRSTGDKHLLGQRTHHRFEVTIISAQQLPRPKDSSGRDVIDKSTVDPFVEVSLHIPDWPEAPRSRRASLTALNELPATAASVSPARTLVQRTGTVKNNGFNPVWEQRLSIPFEVAGDMRELVFVRFAVKQEGMVDEEPLAVYCASLGSLNMGECCCVRQLEYRLIGGVQAIVIFPSTTRSFRNISSLRCSSSSTSPTRRSQARCTRNFISSPIQSMDLAMQCILLCSDVVLYTIDLHRQDLSTHCTYIHNQYYTDNLVQQIKNSYRAWIDAK